MTPEQRDYDRFVAKRIPPGASHNPETEGGRLALDALQGHGSDSGYPEGCSCHMSAPCAFCVRLTEDQADRLWNHDATTADIIEEWRRADEEAEGRPAMTTQLLRDLRKLAARLEPDGTWKPERGLSIHHQVCKVTRKLKRRTDMHKALSDAAGEWFMQWELAPNRTQAEVKALIAAAIVRAGGAG